MNIVNIDRAILETANNEWQKVAMVIAKIGATNTDDFTDDEDDFELIAERIEVLIGEGRLIADGDTSNWRRSEIRLA